MTRPCQRKKGVVIDDHNSDDATQNQNTFSPSPKKRKCIGKKETKQSTKSPQKLGKRKQKAKDDMVTEMQPVSVQPGTQ